MFLWAIHWLFFRLDFGIDLSFLYNQECVLHVLPVLDVVRTPTPYGAYIHLTLGWLLFNITLSYHKDYIKIYDETGQVIGKKLYPMFSIEAMV
jgi:hypothetical protein